jgi:jumonji domain-containing protein 7
MNVLLEDIEPTLPLVHELFGDCGPEAINLWIGDERAVSSLHKDHFENMYAVISGEKSFTLFPPTDLAFFPEEVFPTCRYQLSEEALQQLAAHDEEALATGAVTILSTDLTIVSSSSSSSSSCPSSGLAWTSFDPEDGAAYDVYPSLRRTHPLRCLVRAGEVLYLPAMWQHRVSQTCQTVAVNFWYDQRFDHRCCNLMFTLTSPPPRRSPSLTLSSLSSLYLTVGTCSSRRLFD